MSTLTETAPAITPSASAHDLSTDVWDFSVPVDIDNHARSTRHGSAPSSLKSRTASYPINGDATPMHNRIIGYNSRASEILPITRSATEAPAFFDASKTGTVHSVHSPVSSKNDGGSAPDVYPASKMSTIISTTRNGSILDDNSKWIDRDKLARIEGEDMVAMKWIDRDKLAQIESKEMAQAGILLPLKGSMSSSKTLDNTEPKKQRLPSPTSGDSLDGESDQEKKIVNYDPRHPAEIAMDTMPNQTRQSLKNGSKIPLSVASPIPVRQHILERSAPLIRQPPSSDQGSDEDDLSGSYMRSRKRSYSAGSGVLLNGDSESSTAATAAKPARGSRSQSQTVGTTAPGRKNSTKTKRTTNSNLAKNRSKSNPQLNGARPTSGPHSQRESNPQPGSSGKSHTHHAPDGPPPWSLSTYSPDPKLPPEEQIIPTVAKRLQQEQWEKEGKFATVYDGKLRPLKVEEGIDPNKSEYKHQEDENTSNSPPASPPENPENPELKEERQDRKGKPISRIPHNVPQVPPKVPSSVPPLNGLDARIETTITGPLSKQGTKAGDVEKKKEKSKFCCCIVM